MLEPGTPLPDFTLTDVRTGQPVSPSGDQKSRGVLILFICAHCPYVKHVEAELAAIGRDYVPQGLKVVAICSNDAEHYPEDAPPALKAQAERLGFNFPYCCDATQQVAHRFRAACTPDLFLFDHKHRLVYRGQLDDSRPGNDRPVTGHDLRAAIECVLAGRPVKEEQRPATGCNIKWKPGNEPEYFNN
jgi:peroxiredoxin